MSTGPRRLGSGAAARRASDLRNGEKLPPNKERMLAIVGRLIVVFENATNRAYHDGELTKEGEVRVLVDRTIPTYFDRITEGLRYVFSDDAEDVFGRRV